MGICHADTPDGRCRSLLKRLLASLCIHVCADCIHRRSARLRRARIGVDDGVRLILDFHRRNGIDGPFLSSGILRSSDCTMERLVRVARQPRQAG